MDNDAVNSSDTVISSGMVVSGTVRGKGPLLVQGRIDGRVLLEGDLRIAAKGTVQADIEVDVAEVKGSVKGTIKARQSVSVEAGAQIDGPIESPRIEIDPQARVKARLVMALNLPRGVKVPTAARDPWAS